MRIKINYLIINILLLSAALFTCGKTNVKSSDLFLRLGDGGGFTGRETVFTLYKDGNLEKDGTFVGKIKKGDLQQILQNMETLQLSSIEWNSPGNIYQFIELQSTSGPRRIAWNPYDTEHPKSLELFYNYVISVLHKIKS